MFFGTGDQDQDLPFDPFSVVFYLLTRYEEYLPFSPDPHGRFRPSDSLAGRENFLDIPLADEIKSMVREMVTANYPETSWNKLPFLFSPTFDIDIAFAHLGKGMTRTIAAWAKLMLQGRFSEMKERWAVIQEKLPDPFENFDVHLGLAEKYGLELKYFVLMGDFGKHDRNTSFKDPRFRKLIRKLSDRAEVGLHPSYRAHLDPVRTRRELERLSEITGMPVTSSRFHFLRLKFPDSFRLLIDIGITDDYSLGYSSVNGFRAGTAGSFFFYDLLKEERTTLRLHPFIFMDTAMADHLKMTPADASDEIRRLLATAGGHGGTAIGIWHNYALSEKGHYQGSRQVLRDTFSAYSNPHQ